MYSTKTVPRKRAPPVDIVEDGGGNDDVPTLDPAVYVIYEDDEHAQVFFDELARLDVPYKKWHVGGGYLDLHKPPPPGVYWSRVSPSSALRGHEHCIPYVRDLLTWLHLHGRTVVNGIGCYDVEMSKAVQSMHALKAGLHIPRTYVASGTAPQIYNACKWSFFRGEPFFIKPLTGGSGVSVQRVATPGALLHGIEKGRVSCLNTPTNKAAIVMQSCAGWRGEGVDDGIRRCFRAEFVDGEFLYLLHIEAKPDVYSLCPCDDGKIAGATFSIVPEPAGVVSGWTEFVDACIRFMNFTGASIAAFEFAIGLTGEAVVFDVNFNNNYSALAEKAFGEHSSVDIVSGVGATAKLLESKLKEVIGSK